MIFLNNDIYDGDWNNNVKSGFGIYKYHSGEVYEGFIPIKLSLIG